VEKKTNQEWYNFLNILRTGYLLVTILEASYFHFFAVLSLVMTQLKDTQSSHKLNGRLVSRFVVWLFCLVFGGLFPRLGLEPVQMFVHGRS